jgi:hypothetical protein
MDKEYTLGKIASRNENRSNVFVGQAVTGYAYTFGASGCAVRQEMLIPEIGRPVQVVRPGLSGEYIRTSLVTSWCALMTDNDKLILPKDFPIERLPKHFDFKEGDILIATKNSVYLAKLLK